MDNGLTGLLGLCRKAGKAQVGEECAALAAKAHKARLILLSADAGESLLRLARRLEETGNCPVLSVPLTKAELGGAVGRASCAILAITDVGLANAAVKKLAADDPEGVAGIAQRLEYKAEKTLRRRRETRQREKAAQAEGRKPWTAPPQKKKPS